MDVPVAVRRKAELAGASDWLRGLPREIAAVSADWHLTLGPTYPDGTEALVLQVSTDDGRPAVLKVHIPRDDDAHARHEATVLDLAGGDGCVRLLRSDLTRRALLLERLGPSMAQSSMRARDRQATLADLAARVWRPAPDCGLPTGAEKARWLGEYVTAEWERLDRPCSEAAVAHALACAARREAAHDDERARLVHGDVHQWNALRGGSGYLLVDPDGLLAEPEYDLGVIMREDPVELMAGDARERARWLAARTGTDATAVWEWGVLERVSTGLVATGIELQPVGRQMLDAADRIARGEG